MLEECLVTQESRCQFLYAYGINDGVNPVQESSGVTLLANILPGLGIDEFFTRTDVGAGVTSNLITDALGSVLALADSAGVVQSENTYEPFGRTTVTGASNTNPFQYTGRENDGTGLYHYRARYYHPQLQRFTSEDPIEFAGRDINLYAYVLNNPTNLSDPHGLIGYGGAYGLGAGLGALGGALGARKDPLWGGIVGGLTGAALSPLIPAVPPGLLGAGIGAYFGAVQGATAAVAGGATSPSAVLGGALTGAVGGGIGGFIGGGIGAAIGTGVGIGLGAGLGF